MASSCPVIDDFAAAVAFIVSLFGTPVAIREEPAGATPR
jgi:hypothetical protein